MVKFSVLLIENYTIIEEGRGKSEEAVILRKKLEGLFGANHEELQRADIMLQLF